MFVSPTSTAIKKKSPIIKKNVTKEQFNSSSSYQPNQVENTSKSDNYQKQQFLKRILREYGLQQYLRVRIFKYF